MRTAVRRVAPGVCGRRWCKQDVPELEYWKTAALYYQEKLQALQQFTGQCARMSNGFDEAARGWEYLGVEVEEGINYEEFFEKYSKPSRCCVLKGLAVHPAEWGDLQYWANEIGDDEVPLIQPSPTAPRGLQPTAPTDFSTFAHTYARRAAHPPSTPPTCTEIKLPASAPHLLEHFTVPKYFSQDLLQFAFQNNALRESQVDNRGQLERDEPRAALPALYLGDDLHVINGYPEVLIASRGLQSSLYHNPFSQHMWVHVASGVQEWHIFHPDYAPSLFDEGSNTYAMDATEPDFEAFPSAIMAYPTKVTLRAGDTLFIPSDSPVQWKVIEDSISTSMPFVDWSNVESSTYDVERAASCGDPACREIMKGFNMSFLNIPQCGRASDPVDTPYGAYLTWRNDAVVDE